MRATLKAIDPDAARMNKTEASFNAQLTVLKKAGRIQWFMFEGLKLRLGHTCFYTPDFIALDDAGKLIAYEVKGFWRDDARVKIKVAARAYPWIRFVAVKKIKGGFDSEDIKP